MKHHGSPRRPSIAITPDLSAPTAQSPHPKYEVKVAYADAVLRAGGLPFVLPYSEERSVVDAWLDRVSGLLITGGAFDIPCELYGEKPREGMGETRPARTSFELTALRLALARKLPILGICGGMQLVNVAFGGTLLQDISRELPQAKSHEQKHDRSQPQHPIDVRDHTQLAEAVGRGQMMVNSTHHQSVSKVGEGLVVAATAPDGVIEAIETRDGLVVGVQWHPELMVDSVPPNLGVYRSFVAKARDRRH
jgi:putative glutamine amidotransferase